MRDHDALFARILEMYEPTIFRPSSPSDPFLALSETLAKTCANDVTLLDDFARRLQAQTPGSVKGAALLLAYERCAFARLGPWFTPQLALGYASGIRDLCQDPSTLTYGKKEVELGPNWSRLCPPEVAKWLVLDPCQGVEAPEVAMVWRFTMERVSNRVAQWIEDRIPGWDDHRLIQAWARPVLDGIRPSGFLTSLKAKQNTANWMRHALDQLGHVQVQTDPCFGRWQDEWKKNPAAWATWQSHADPGLSISSASARPRMRP